MRRRRCGVGGARWGWRVRLRRQRCGRPLALELRDDSVDPALAEVVFLRSAAMRDWRRPPSARFRALGIDMVHQYRQGRLLVPLARISTNIVGSLIGPAQVQLAAEFAASAAAAGGAAFLAAGGAVGCPVLRPANHRDTDLQIGTATRCRRCVAPRRSSNPTALSRFSFRAASQSFATARSAPAGRATAGFRRPLVLDPQSEIV